MSRQLVSPDFLREKCAAPNGRVVRILAGLVDDQSQRSGDSSAKGHAGAQERTKMWNERARGECVLKHRACLLAALLVVLWVTPAKADSRIIVRTTLGLQGLQQLCGLPLLQNCSVVGGLGDPLNQTFLVTTPLDATTFLNLLRALPGIVDAELDQLISLLGGLNRVTTPPAALSDSTPITYYTSTVWNGYVNQPAAQIVRVQAAQSQFQVAGSGIVADIDTGVDPGHPALAGVLLQGYDFTRNQPGASELNDLSPADFSSPPPPCPPSTCPPAVVNQSSAAILDQSSAAILDTNAKYAAFGHGTMVMGVLHLVAPKASLLPLKAFHSDGTGYLSDIVRAIYYAIQNGANIVNMSFDLTTNSPELVSALAQANQSALICAASAGNDGQKEIVYPAALQSEVMGVASTNDLDMRSSFSNYGDAIVWVAAPGEGIVTTYPFSTYAAGWGTSFSAPFTSGGSSLLRSKQPGTNESQAAAAVAHAVAVGADMGNGRLDLVLALQALSPADFSLSVNPPTTTVNAGQSAAYTLTLTPISGFTQMVTLSCGGFPIAATCVITPPSVTLDGSNPTSATVTVQTTARAAMVPAARGPGIRLPWELAVLSVWLLAGGLAWLLLCQRPERRRPGLAAALGLLAVFLGTNSCGGNGRVTVVQPGSGTLSSLTLNPTSVNGGSSSTGRATLSGPAPPGGTTVSLGSSNTSVASVPASVTVAAGTAIATFQVATASVANSTQVSISASLSGASQQTASLTVTPTPPSGPALTSLTLNPGSVVGGSPSAGTVMLSAPAPNGGALVSLASSNSAVGTVAASVTVPAGATSATFTVNTSTVTTATSIAISASYAGVTRADPITVTPALPPGTPAGNYVLTITGKAGNLSHNTNVSLVVN